MCNHHWQTLDWTVWCNVCMRRLFQPYLIRFHCKSMLLIFITRNITKFSSVLKYKSRDAQTYRRPCQHLRNVLFSVANAPSRNKERAQKFRPPKHKVTQQPQSLNKENFAEFAPPTRVGKRSADACMTFLAPRTASVESAVRRTLTLKHVVSTVA